MRKVSDLPAPSGASFYWSRVPGKFVYKKTGEAVTLGFDFNGTVREWYETLVETIVDVAHSVRSGGHKTGKTFVVVHPDVDMILQCSVLTHMDLNDRVENGVRRSGELHTTDGVDIFVDPDQIRNKVTVGFDDLPEDPAAYGTVTIVDLHVD